MELSVLITSLPSTFEEALPVLAKAGFRHVDLIGKSQRNDSERHALADSGLIVDCVAVGRDLPDGCSLDAVDLANRRRAVDEVQKHIADAAQLGARVAYVVPCKSNASLPAFTDSCNVLAQFARSRMIQLCIEHFPGSALATASGTLDWLRAGGLEEMKLLLDLGHCLITKEDPCHVATNAGDRLGYVQLDDNDGVGDVHWPLLSGALTEVQLREFLHCLQRSHAQVGVALELNSKLDEPLRNVVVSKKAVEEAWSGRKAK